MSRQPGAPFALAALCTLVSCAGHPTPPQPSAPAAALAPLDAGVHRPHADTQPFPHAHLLTTLDRRALGPFVARAGDDGLAAWIVGNARGSGQVLYVVPLGADGASLSPPVAAASLHDGTTQLVVRPRGRPGAGWLVGWSSLLDRGEALSVLSIDVRGSPRTDPVEIERTSDHLAWFDFSPGPKGALCTWAEETSAGVANVLAVGLGVDGKPVGVPARVAQGVSRWAVLSGAAGTGLALADAGGKDSAGRLTWASLDPDGHLQGTPIPIGSGPTVGSDIDGGAAGDGWLVAWTDRAGVESHVAVARVDAARRVEGPARPFENVGSSALVGTASGPRGTLVAWESPRATAHPFRDLHLSTVSRDKGLLAQPAGSLEIASKVAPELVATDDGYALLASARVCLSGRATQGRCTGPLAPTFVRLGSALEPLQTEPILLGESRAPAAIAWGLRCAPDRCTVLAATGDTPTEVYVVDLAPRASPFAAPLEAPPPADAPRVTSVRAVASGEAFVDVAAARLGGTTLLATLSLPQGSGERDAKHAATAGGTAALRVLDAAGQPTAAPTIVSSRATPTGGIAIAPAIRAEDGAAIAWVKPDGGVPQVHLAHVDKAGRRTREMQLTSSKVDTSTVSIATVDDGWLVAWVDGRHGSGEVYATKVDFRLDRAAKDERITSAPGDAADVMLAVPAGDDHPVAWLAWSDPRESPSEGLGDIYVTQIRARDAHRSADEVRVLATAAHSRSPRLIAFRDAGGPGAVVAWLEDAPAGLEGPAAVLVARLDATGHVVGSANRMPLPPDCRPSDVALGRDEARGGIRAIVSCASGGAVTLDAARLGTDAAVTAGPTTLLDLEAPAAFETGLALAGDAIFFTDYGGGPADHRVRRAVIDWR